MENSGPIKTRGKKVSIRITEVVQVAATHHTIVPVHILRITGSVISLTLITNIYDANNVHFFRIYTFDGYIQPTIREAPPNQKRSFYRTQVNLGSDLWVRMSVCPSQTETPL